MTNLRNGLSSVGLLMRLNGDFLFFFGGLLVALWLGAQVIALAL